jgi:hypothetical protein
MFLPIKASTVLIFVLGLILFLPAFHLLFIFFIMGMTEWVDKLFKKIYNLILCLYEIIEHVLENPVIRFAFICFLCVSIRRLAAV